MISQKIYINIIIKVLLLIIVTAACVWFFVDSKQLILGFLFLIAMIFVASQLIFYLNSVNRKIAYFFNAVQNEDSTLYYPEKLKDGSYSDLNKSLNRLNNLIQDVKVKNREQEQYFSALLEKVATGIVIINQTGHILQSNQNARKLLNYNTLTHIAQLKKVDNELYEAFLLIKDKNQQLVKLAKNNNISELMLHATNFSTKNKNYVLVSIQDIRNELEAKEVEAWIKLIRILTHEIMNSIAPITSLSDTLLGYYENKEKIDKKNIRNTITGLEIIKERGNGLIHFVNSYRKLTKIPEPDRNFFSLSSLIEKIRVLTEKDIQQQNIDLKVTVKPDNLMLYADESQISQVLLNIVKNAIEALKNSLQPTINLSARIEREQQIKICVEDNGKGISSELMEQIFIPFFTTKENGSGIGLSLSRQIMRLHRGTINVYSEPNKFTRITLTF